jgi:hypothetical protein
VLFFERWHKSSVVELEKEQDRKNFSCRRFTQGNKRDNKAPLSTKPRHKTHLQNSRFSAKCS